MHVEQAIFTSARTTRNEGYQMVAHSRGIAPEDLQTINAWSPAHDAMLSTRADAVSINAFRLPTGKHCVSRTCYAGEEYSGRAGLRLYTQHFVLPEKVLERFQFHSFRVLEALRASGNVQVLQRFPVYLDSIRLLGRGSLLRKERLEKVVQDGCHLKLLRLLDAIHRVDSLGVVQNESLEHYFALLIDLLPAGRRTEVSFSTGLRPSARRPFQLVAMPVDSLERRREQNRHNLATLDLKQLPQQTPVSAPWAQLVSAVLDAQRFDVFESALRRAERYPELDYEQLVVRLRIDLPELQLLSA